MSFQIVTTEGNALTMSQLDIEAGVFWQGESFIPDKEWYATPDKEQMKTNWFDAIGYNIHRMHELTGWGKDWRTVKMVMTTVHMNFAMNDYFKKKVDMEGFKSKIEHSINYLKPYLDLIDHWESKGYQPKCIKE